MGLLATSTYLKIPARGPHPAELSQVPQDGLSGAGSRARASGTEGKGLDQISFFLRFSPPVTLHTDLLTPFYR